MRTYVVFLSLLSVCSMILELQAQPDKTSQYGEVLPESPVSNIDVSGTCPEKYLRAENLFFRGFFDETLEMLAACWEDKGDNLELNLDQHTEVMLMLAISNHYLEKDQETEAKMRYLMREVNPKFRANAEEHPIEIQELAEKYRLKWFHKPWIVGSAGVVIGGAIVCAFICGEDPLPFPPDPPPTPTPAN